MAVVSVHEIWEGREGSQVLDGRRREYTRVFEVTTSTPADGPVVALGFGATALGLPLFGSPHPEDFGAVVQEITPTQNSESPTRWTVAVKYSSELPAPEAAQPGASETDPGTENDPAELPENPLARPPVWKFGFEKFQEVARFGRLVTAGVAAANPTPITNSASVPFDPPQMVEVSRPTVSVTINRATWNFPAAVALQDAVNAIAWRGAAPRTVKCVSVDAQSQYENGTAYWQVTYNLALKWDTWDLQILDAGLMERVYAEEVGGGATKLRRIRDAAGQDIPDPVPLDGNGLRLKVGDPPVYRVYRYFREVNFSALIA
jgi:hypothetical protein